MKVVLDCNVFISAGLTAGTCSKVSMQVLTNHTHYISDEIIREYRDVISRKKFESHKPKLIELLKSICIASVWIRNQIPNNKEFILPDIGDQKYLDLALEVSADFLITGNNMDFPLKKYRSLEVLSPQEFLNLSNS